uniref:Transcription termination factor MTEF1, chloroplastic n=1 Tax=Ananas comosus var. bracteatus TaxID=296719 RepID=A0A6V7PLS0_ANACO|nr:unnamed protein product [Ananas comosus var. bracteatus]
MASSSSSSSPARTLQIPLPILLRHHPQSPSPNLPNRLLRLVPESAISASQKLRFKSTENPNAVLRLLRDYGFCVTHISKLISRFPAVLSSDPYSTLRRSSTLFGESLARVVTAQPMLLKRSLKKHIIFFGFYSVVLGIPNVLYISSGHFVATSSGNPNALL